MKARPHDVHDTSGSSADLRTQLAAANRIIGREREMYRQALEGLERELHEARENFADYAEEAGQKVDDLKEQTESWKNVGDIWQTECKRLYERLALAEKVVEAAKGYRDVRDEMQSSAAYDALYAALVEWEGK